MRVVVVSDSHRRYDIIERILRAQPTARHVFFLGDNTADIEKVQQGFPDRLFHKVPGNCDPFDMSPNYGIERLAGVGIFYAHGHTLNVKSGMGRLLEMARRSDCKIALYGHTHVARMEYTDDGIYLINPGSCSQSREGRESYAVIDIEENGIMPVIITL